MMNPSKIQEGGVEYSLGKVDGKKIIYDFSKMLIYWVQKGSSCLVRSSGSTRRTKTSFASSVFISSGIKKTVIRSG